VVTVVCRTVTKNVITFEVKRSDSMKKTDIISCDATRATDRRYIVWLSY